jgi:TatD DNase family protein
MDLIKFADSHCHLNYDGLIENSAEVILRMKKANVDIALNVCTSIEESNDVLNMALSHDFLVASVGVHPDNEGVEEASIQLLVDKASNKKIAAIGETGLDYFRLKGDLSWQRERFRKHIRAAKEVGKPLIIHTRNAPIDTIKILKEEKADELGGVMHCFTENLEMAKKSIDLNFLISLSGIVTFKNASQVHEVAREINLKHLMIETDSPFLAPVPHRGKTNEPAFVINVAKKIAEIKSESIENVARITRNNFINFIGDSFSSLKVNK